VPGIPRLAALSPRIGRPFQVKRFRESSVCWLNTRWLLSKGVDATEPGTRCEWERWLLDTFAFGAPRPARDNEPESFYIEGCRTLYADRYGAPGGTPGHGGSGRCGYHGSFNAKGIGPTPLVGRADWYHAHGCMWLEEAMREAVLAELAAAEFPWGAVPVVAVIRIHDVLQRPDGSFEPPRAILVRPNFIRPAHFERSILFGTSGHEDSDQYIDAIRTEQAIRTFCMHCRGEHSLGLSTTSIAETFRRIGAQIGYGWASRLFHGGYFSSNLTMDGELVDFGSFRALPSWRRAFSVRSTAPFGSELDALKPVVDSLSFYFAKYGDVQNQIDSASTMREIRDASHVSFRHSCLEGLSILGEESRDIQDHAMEIVIRYFHRQQQTVVNYFNGEQKRRVSWAYSGVNERARTEFWDGEAETEFLQGLAAVCGTSGGGASNNENLLLASKRWLRPRPLAYRENLQRVIEGAIRNAPEPGMGSAQYWERLVDTLVSRSRRRWPGLLENLVLLAQVSRGGCSALYCVDPRKNEFSVIIEAIKCADMLHVFGKRIPFKAVSNSLLVTSCREGVSTLAIQLPSWRAGRGVIVNIGAHSCAVPRPDVMY